MASYEKKVGEVMVIFNRAGINLLEKKSILGYCVFSDRAFHTISNEPDISWNEYPAAYALYKFGDNAMPKYLILSAILEKEYSDEEGVFILTHEIFSSLPKLEDYKAFETKDKNAYNYSIGKHLENLVNGIIMRESEKSDLSKFTAHENER